MWTGQKRVQMEKSHVDQVADLHENVDTSEGVCDGNELSQAAVDEPIFSPRKSLHDMNSEMLQSEENPEPIENKEKVTRTMSINEGDCEMMDIESDKSSKENSEDSAVEITHSHEVGNDDKMPKAGKYRKHRKTFGSTGKT